VVVGLRVVGPVAAVVATAVAAVVVGLRVVGPVAATVVPALAGDGCGRR
jgi:hypothetical protein